MSEHGGDELGLPTVEVFSTDFWKAFAPETILICGLLLIFLIPNLGNSKFRIPLTKVRVPWFLGGRRFKLTGRLLFRVSLQQEHCLLRWE